MNICDIIEDSAKLLALLGTIAILIALYYYLTLFTERYYVMVALACYTSSVFLYIVQKILRNK